MKVGNIVPYIYSIIPVIRYLYSCPLYFPAFAVRLADGKDYWGRVEVRYHGLWGRVCRQGWDDKDATVTCQELGFAGGVAFGHYKEGSGPHWMSRVNCTGTEKSLAKCNHTGWGTQTAGCDKAADAHVLCYRHGNEWMIA